MARREGKRHHDLDITKACNVPYVILLLCDPSLASALPVSFVSKEQQKYLATRESITSGDGAPRGGDELTPTPVSSWPSF